MDVKHAWAFNFTTVNRHFEQLQKLFDDEGIPLQNLHNFDEIGIQLGGGQKSSGEQFFFGAADRSKYKITSDDLELVTVLETVCANGTSPVKPCFVFSGIKMCNEWFVEEDNIL